MSDCVFEFELYRRECPIGRCNWVCDRLTGDAGRRAFLEGGEIRVHVEKYHILMEWVQEVMDLRRELGDRMKGGAALVLPDRGDDRIGD